MGIEVGGGRHGTLGKRRGPGGLSKFEGKLTTVGPKGLKAAPRSYTALMSELEFGVCRRLGSGGR